MLRRAVAPVLVLLLLTGACGGDRSESTSTEGVATLRDQEPGGSSTTVVRLSFEEAALQFTACLRDNGIEVPDVRFGPDGQPLLDPGAIAGVDVGSTEFQSAFVACLPIIQNAGALQRDLDPEQQALIQDQLQEFSVCMRNNGVPDFPDPDPTSALSYPLSAFADFQSDDFQSAVEACQEITAQLDFGADDS